MNGTKKWFDKFSKLWVGILCQEGIWNPRIGKSAKIWPNLQWIDSSAVICKKLGLLSPIATSYRAFIPPPRMARLSHHILSALPSPSSFQHRPTIAASLATPHKVVVTRERGKNAKLITSLVPSHFNFPYVLSFFCLFVCFSWCFIPCGLISRVPIRLF